MKSAENPTPTWLRFQQLDSASGETATSSNLGRPTRIQFSTDPLPTTGLPEIPQEPPVFQQPSSPATSTVDAISHSTPFEAEWKFYSKNSKTSPSIQKKQFHPQGLDYKSDISCTDVLISEREMLRYDTIGKIELNPSFVLSSDNTNYKNDIQLFHQLFDELSVYRDYH